MDKTQQTLAIWCQAPGFPFKDVAAEESYKKRAQRIADVIQLKTPDRVPVTPAFGFFPAIDNGYTCEEVMFDFAKAHEAWMKTLTQFEPDLFFGSAYALPGPALEILNYKPLRLPGRGISPRHGYQFVGKEYIKAEEFYDQYLDDPSDFMLRNYLTRVCGALEPLKMVRPFSEYFSYYLSIMGNLALFSIPEVAGALETLSKAAGESLKWVMHIGQEIQETMSMGFPSEFCGQSAAPYDIVGDWFRGTQGVMLDMYRCPDKLLTVMDKLVPRLIDMGVQQSRQLHSPFVGLMLHLGTGGLMSLEQFKTFYWAPLRKVMMGIIEEGLVPVPLFEGDYTSRLEVIKDIPRGKAIYWFEQVDIHQAKEILGDTVCFRGNVPISLLCTGTPEDVKNYVKKLIDVVGKKGGLIVDSGVWFDEAKRENIKAMVDFTRQYGVYA